MTDNLHTILIILVASLVTLLIRFLPFIVFKKHTPKAIIFLGNVLPYSIMGMLVVYCLKDMSFTNGTYGIPEIVSVLAVILLYKWKHNTLISILFGTIIYMLLIQLIF